MKIQFRNTVKMILFCDKSDFLLSVSDFGEVLSESRVNAEPQRWKYFFSLFLFKNRILELGGGGACL